MDAQIKKRRTLDAIKRILLRESLNQPLMVIFEDLHWIDEETQALLNLLADSIGTAKILLLVNYRPEYRINGAARPTTRSCGSIRSARRAPTRCWRALLGDGAGTAQPLKRLIIETDRGQSVLHGRDGAGAVRRGRAGAQRRRSRSHQAADELKIPPTVQGDPGRAHRRLPADEKDLLQTLAVIGREFPLAWCERWSRKSDDELNRMLDDLQLAEFIYEQPASPIPSTSSSTR